MQDSSGKRKKKKVNTTCCALKDKEIIEREIILSFWRIKFFFYLVLVEDFELSFCTSEPKKRLVTNEKLKSYEVFDILTDCC